MLYGFANGQDTPVDFSIDSLKSLISKEKTTGSIDSLYFQLAKAFENTNLDSSLFYANLVIERSLRSGNKELLGTAYINSASLYFRVGISDKGLNNLYKAQDLYEEVEDMPGLIRTFMNIGAIHYRNREFDKALEYYQKSEESYLSQEDFPERKNYSTYGRLLNNMGIVYDNQRKVSLAREYYSKAISESEKNNDIVNLGNAYSNMGTMYQRNNQYELAKTNFEEALNFRKSINDTYGMTRSYGHIGSIYQDLENFDSARTSFEKGYELAQQIKSPHVLVEIADHLHKVYKELGMTSEAYETLGLQKQWEDSLYGSKMQKEMAELELGFEFERKQKEAELIQAKREKVYIVTGILLAAVAIVSILLFWIKYIRTVNIELQKERLELSNKNLSLEKDTLEQQLEFKNKELTTNVMYLMKKNELLNDVSQRLFELKSNLKKENHRPVQKIITELNYAKDDDTWEEFEMRFQQVYNDFYDRLIEQFPDLSSNEKKLCAFLRLNMSTKEICAITGQTINTLNVARARLRKKLRIDSDTNLISFLEKL